LLSNRVWRTLVGLRMAKADKNKDKQPDREEQSPTASYDIPICGVGTQIGHFCIKEEIGRGGMGVVYLAQDTKLDRQVAIKSIPPLLSNDEKVQSRFNREAKLLASLDHPDIATIHDIVEDKGISYLVLEYIPGDTLRDRITQGPLPAKEVLSIGGQIADAFASAHEHGIVHRDLKPANIKITREHRVKVLDFGIAKAVGSPDSNAYTTVTEPGQLIGTPAYMSPEQARGKPTDERGDIWSFGCVLYEMLTGKPPFQGETASDTLAGVLGQEPDWDTLPPATPANVKVLIRRCLEKDPQQRLQHMGDVALEIRETLSLPALVPPMTVSAMTVTQPATLRRSIITKVAALFLTAVVVSLVNWSIFGPPPTLPPGPIKLSIPLTPTEKADLISISTPVLLSPDGKQLVLRYSSGERTVLCVRSLDDFEFKPIRGTENSFDPFFSPDGQWLAFFTAAAPDKRLLWKVRMDHSFRKVLIAECQFSWGGGTWSDDGLIFFAGGHDDLFQVSPNGGTPEILNVADPNLLCYYPSALPDGKTIMHSWGGTISLLSRVTGKSSMLVRNTQGGYYSSSGHLLFMRNRQLFAIPFDVNTLKKTGPELLVITDVFGHGLQDTSYFSIARTGTLAYAVNPSESRSLVWADHEGNMTPVIGSPDSFYRAPRLSPDETELAVIIDDNRGRNLWKYDLNRHVSTQLTYGSLSTYCPRWVLPDAKRISFSSFKNDAAWKPQLYTVSTDGSGKLEELIPDNLDYWRRAFSWSPDGKYLVYLEHYSQTPGVLILPFGDDGKPGEPALFLGGKQYTENMTFHPSDGSCVAYSSAITGNSEIYIKDFLWGNLSEGWVERISSQGGTEPCWSRDGTKLFYRSNRGMMEVTIGSNPDGTIDVATSQVLFDDSIYSVGHMGLTNYDVTSDGRFLMVKKSPLRQINVILNFDEELKRLAPTGKK
jgi:eukaryotic-like serine/threonine-protein kinase